MRPEPTSHSACKEAEELAPYLEAAMARKTMMAPLAEDQIPSFVALGRKIAATQLTPEEQAAQTVGWRQSRSGSKRRKSSQAAE